MPIDPKLQMALDLPLKDKPSIRMVSGKRKRKGGYAALPGTGPQGEKCKTCRHIRRVQGGAKTFPKCALICWTKGPGTDIKVGAPACSRWAPQESAQP